MSSLERASALVVGAATGAGAGSAAFFFSAAFCSSDTLRIFNEKGMEIGATDENGDTVYEIAKKYGNTENQNYALNRSAGN